MSKDRQSQNDRIALWLDAGRTLTPMQALQRFGCSRLAARINDLRREGWRIIGEDVTVNGKRFRKYRLA